MFVCLRGGFDAIFSHIPKPHKAPQAWKMPGKVVEFFSRTEGKKPGLEL